jgi:hypothetical protein
MEIWNADEMMYLYNMVRAGLANRVEDAKFFNDALLQNLEETNAENSEFSDVCREMINQNIQYKSDFGYYIDLRRKYVYLCNKYGNISADGVTFGEKSPVIWWCWLQGLENAPRLVKACYESCKMLGMEIKVITADNFSQYVTIPDFILQKYRTGAISNTHFSDILRLELLTSYGGTWIDATVLVTGKNILKYFEDEPLFFFQDCYNYVTNYMINGSSWLISACMGEKILEDTKAILYEYWKNEESLIDYFLLHLCFTIACQNNNQMFEKVPVMSSDPPHIMQAEMYHPHTDKDWGRLCGMSDVHKLTWKSERPQTEEKLIYDYIVGMAD